MGFVTANVPPGHPAFGQAFPCPECGGPVDLQAREYRRLETYFGSVWMLGSPKLEQFRLDDFERLPRALRDGKDSALPVLRAWVSGEALTYDHLGLAAPTPLPFEPTQAVVIYGAPGLGKTCAASAAFVERVSAAGKLGLAIEYNALMRCIQARYADEHGDSEQAIRAAATVPVLLVDDLGNTFLRGPETNDKQRLLFEVLNYRYNYRLPTLITTNLGYGELVEQFDLKLGQRLAEWALWVEMGGLSLRIRGE